jgi:transcriptional regulator with XRE-family HTH domain
MVFHFISFLYSLFLQIIISKSMEKTILQIFGDNVRRERLKRKLSQEELANVADLHRTYIGMIERAEKNITMLNAQKIADSLKISLTELLITKDEY